jgi:hypothetical protein
MPPTRTKFIRLLRITAAIAIVAAIIGYGIWRSLAYARGPSIEIYSPIDGSSSASTTIEIVGKASRINSLTVNNNPVSVDENGNFKVSLVVFQGTNIATVAATDQFGRSLQKQIRILGTR